jgi:hypothetical protein
MLSYIDLEMWYEITDILVNNTKYLLTEIESMLPWEREIYQTIYLRNLKEENERRSRK